MTAATIAAVVEIAQKLMASFAFLVGGVWVWMNYVRNRTHVQRLQVDVKAEFSNVATGIIWWPPAKQKTLACPSLC